MNLNAAFYDDIQNTAVPFYRAMMAVQQQREQPEPVPLLQVRRGRAESPAWYMIQAAEFHPEPLTVAKLRVRDIYASESIALALLEMLAGETWLDRRGDEYFLTEEGRTVMNRLKTRAANLLQEVTPPSHLEIVKLEGLLQRVIEASLLCPTPPGNWCLAYSRRRASGDDAPALVRLYHYIADFNAFRDDAHMAAWQPLGIKGFEWEAFSFVASEQADTAVALFQQIAYRGYSQEDYTAALQNLSERGWLTQVDDTHQLTDAGRAVQTEVEQRTDNYFYAPWHEAFDEAEIAETIELLRVLRDEWQS
jgi:DNA-binding MarR family transcriptional regulator